jgi:hypothetical protein
MIAASALVLLPFFLGISRAAQIVSFSPEGTVKEVRQVKAIFSEPMTAIGDKRENIPFDILCSEKGYPRWVDGITWIYDFIDELPGGCRCSFEAKRDLKSLSGSVLTGRSRFSFSTGGPVIVKSIPESGNSSIENSQIFVLELNAEADEASIISNAWFSIKGIGEKVGVSVIKGKDRTAVLNYVHYKGKDKKVIILQARRTFPDMTQVSLVWGAGIKSLSGVAGEKDQVLNFSTKEPFKASFSCSKENPNSPCVPLSPMELDFTSDFPDRYKNEITLKGTDGRVFKAEKFNDFIYFYGPFTPNTEYLLDLPKTMMDNEGRRLANASKFPMRIKTGGMPALAKFSSRFGILEKADAVLPLTVRNIETSTATSQSQARRNYAGLRIRYLNIPTDNDSMMIEWLKRTAQAKREQSVFSKNSPAMDIPVDFKGNQTDFRVVGIPLKNQGLNIVEIESRILGSYLLGKSSPLYVPTAALVTNLGVHFKKGRENSLVWVTALDTGKPVGGASVSLRDCRGGL